jgi:heptosyltransferase III
MAGDNVRPVSKATTKAPRSVVIANPHAIGDALMMFPMAGAIRRQWPGSRLYFAGRPYVSALVQACEFFDGFIDSQAIVDDPAVLTRLEADVFLNPFPDDALARAAFAARVPIRVGNLFRRSAIYCNRYVAYGSTLKSHVLGFYLLHPRVLGVPTHALPSGHRELFGLTRVGALPESLGGLLDPRRFNLILHPKSGGSGREWPLQHFLELARSLAAMNAFKLFVTGSDTERALVESECPELLHGGLAVDLMGALPPVELLSLVNAADGLLASSTGPLHMAAALGRHALGIYAAGYGLDALAWGPVGPLARTLQPPGSCRPGVGNCPRSKGPPCNCTRTLSPADVVSRLVMPAFLHGSNGQGRAAVVEHPGVLGTAA